MKRTRLAIIACLLWAPAVAQDNPRDGLTYKRLNGRVWRHFDERLKWIYTQAVDDALIAAMVHAGNSPCRTEADGFTAALTPEGLTGVEQRRAIDRFYEEPENSPIAIIDAMQIVAARARSVPQDVIDAKLLQLRRGANEAPERK